MKIDKNSFINPPQIKDINFSLLIYIHVPKKVNMGCYDLVQINAQIDKRTSIYIYGLNCNK